jgi:serum/glucocorticoid-regulated kinase 2
VRHCSNGRLYALKQIKKEYVQNFKTIEQVLREKKILSELINKFPFVTHLESSFESYRHLNFLLVFYPGGEFFYHLTVNKLKESEAKLCFAEIMVTMEQLHKEKILYRDLKVHFSSLSQKTLWWILMDICGWETLDFAGLTCKENK